MVFGLEGTSSEGASCKSKYRHQLSCGLEMMNQAVEGLEVVQPGLEENIGYLRVPEQRHFEAQQKPVTQQAAMSFSMDYMSVKEVYAQTEEGWSLVSLQD
ncbi:septin and tuftelin-interacting protein 1 like protein 2 [Quercus suber]|uniref:Septin and tuftelin-interacting protein 1 like protein 2 n=1 Tax=Quercus suber TaxID=58331 RepID=A0AAW0KKL1_QUESU